MQTGSIFDCDTFSLYLGAARRPSPEPKPLVKSHSSLLIWIWTFFTPRSDFQSVFLILNRKPIKSNTAPRHCYW